MVELPSVSAREPIQPNRPGPVVNPTTRPPAEESDSGATTLETAERTHHSTSNGAGPATNMDSSRGRGSVATAKCDIEDDHRQHVPARLDGAKRGADERDEHALHCEPMDGDTPDGIAVQRSTASAPDTDPVGAASDRPAKSE
eukprot:SAG11_NODE_6958_length_1219_cov_1.711607_1_plen_142_part_01